MNKYEKFIKSTLPFSFLDYIPFIGKKRRQRKKDFITITAKLLELQEKYMKENPIREDIKYTPELMFQSLFYKTEPEKIFGKINWREEEDVL